MISNHFVTTTEISQDSTWMTNIMAQELTDKFWFQPFADVEPSSSHRWPRRPDGVRLPRRVRAESVYNRTRAREGVFKVRPAQKSDRCARWKGDYYSLFVSPVRQSMLVFYSWLRVKGSFFPKTSMTQVMRLILLQFEAEKLLRWVRLPCCNIQNCLQRDKNGIWFQD